MSGAGIYKCSCQTCGEHLEYPESFEGTIVACPHCGEGTELHQPKLTATQNIPTQPSTAAPQPPAASNAPPPMKSSGGRGSVMPPARGRIEPADSTDSTGTNPQTAAPKASQPVPAPEPIPAAETEDPNACVSCGATLEESQTVCVECGHRRPTVSKWSATAIFRIAAGICIACELLVIVLQWTTTGKPFGLRQRTRHAVLVKIGLRNELTPAEAAEAAAKGSNPSTAAAQPKDPDLLLKEHQLITEKSNGAQYITGTIKNISQYRYFGVKVHFALLDAAQQVIPDANVSAYTGSLEAGKEWTFKVLIIDPDAKSYRPLPPVEAVR